MKELTACQSNARFACKEAGGWRADFRYYGALQHQQNMLQDYVRTATYHQAITDNEADFRDKLIMDVGAGTGILSLFAAQVTLNSISMTAHC